MNIYQRSHTLLNPSIFAVADPSAINVGSVDIKPPADQYILRMAIKTPKYKALQIPDELQWAIPMINRCIAHHSANFKSQNYMYITIRCGEIRSVTDDEFHVDGFSMRLPHVPEQSYIWADHAGTEILNQQIALPSNFDGMVHNLHNLIQEVAENKNIETAKDGDIYLIDPYVIHRRPKITSKVRSFIRLSFLPIPILDNKNTPNPLIKTPVFKHVDIRTKLVNYKF